MVPFNGNQPRGTYKAGKFSAWITAVIVAVIAGYILLGHSPLLDVEELEVHGLHHLRLEEVEDRLGFKIGDPLPLGLGESQRKLEELSWVKTADIDRSWSGRITVDISEYKPLALALTEPERWALVADDGTVLTHGLIAPLDLPRLSGVHAAGSPGTYLSADSSALLSLLVLMPPELGDKFFSLRRDSSGEIHGTLRTNQEVIFGDDKRLGAKIISLSAMLDYLEAEKRTDDYIDVSYPEKPIVTNE